MLPDRKKSTYQQLFQELKDKAASINQVWEPEQIITDYETSLIPAISAEVSTIDHFYRSLFNLSFSFRQLYTRGAIFTIAKLYIVVFKVWV